MGKTIIEDFVPSYLVEGAFLIGDPGIPMLMNLNNTQIPLDIVPFDKARNCTNKRQYVHFYVHDPKFFCLLKMPERYVELFKLYDGVITPDFSMLIGQSKCVQQVCVYLNRAIGFFLQKNGIPVIPNIRWSDESSFEYCFLGVPKNNIVAVSTHGCIKSKDQRLMFKKGVASLIEVLEPKAILVHGAMPEEIFGDFEDLVPFYRYPSQLERVHSVEVR
ncbi:MAG: DUF4417 domain-containing protein [Clostridia bacterium]|nr:DUF4417 domain-containing protein [Clostridia bacterium]